MVRIGAPTVFLQRITTTNISNLWMREEQLIKELRDNRHLNIIQYPELGYVAKFTTINFQSYILDKSKLFAPSVVVLLLI